MSSRCGLGQERGADAARQRAGEQRRGRRHQPIQEQLREQLLALPSGAFEHLMARLLEAIGYREVRVLAGSQGGADLCASASQGFSRPVTLVQAKQYRLPVSRRFVDELRGAMLRHHAPHGVLLTTSTFYLPAYRAAGQPGPLPVRLVDGAELLDLLVAHKLGVGVSGTGRPRLDRAYFERLRREHGSLPRVGRPRLGPTRNA